MKHFNIIKYIGKKERKNLNFQNIVHTFICGFQNYLTDIFEECSDFIKLAMNFTPAGEMNSGCWGMKLRVEGGGGGVV